MSDRRAAQVAVQTEHRHQVDRGEGVDRHVVEVVQVRRIETRRRHQVGEQLLVHVIASAAAEFVELDRDEGRLRGPDETGDRPRVRVALLQVVDRPVNEVLPHLLPGALVTKVVRRSVAVDGFSSTAAPIRRQR